MKRIVVVLGCVVAGCGGDRSPTPMDASGDDVSTDSPGAGDSGTYHQGVYTCCGPGLGVSCCSAAAGLLGYEVESDGAIIASGARQGSTEANCFRYGGTLGTCATDGEMFDGKDICSLCCPGLSRVSPSVPDDAGSCVASGSIPISVMTCLPCGNGSCDPGENGCNCPADRH